MTPTLEIQSDNKEDSFGLNQSIFQLGLQNLIYRLLRLLYKGWRSPPLAFGGVAYAELSDRAAAIKPLTSNIGSQENNMSGNIPL